MRTTASIAGHPVHTMLVHFPMAFLMGGFGFDLAVASGWPVPPVIGAYLVRVGLATAALALLPGAVDFISTVRRTGGRQVLKTIAHAVFAVGAMAVFAAALRQRGDMETAPAMAVVLIECAGVGLLGISGLLGGSLVLDDRVGVAEPHAGHGGTRR